MHPFSLNDETLDHIGGGQVPPGTPPLDGTPTSLYAEAGLPPGENTTLRIGEEGGGGEYEV
jgi:hypothetical protein